MWMQTDCGIDTVMTIDMLVHCVPVWRLHSSCRTFSLSTRRLSTWCFQRGCQPIVRVAQINMTTPIVTFILGHLHFCLYFKDKCCRPPAMTFQCSRLSAAAGRVIVNESMLLILRWLPHYKSLFKRKSAIIVPWIPFLSCCDVILV